MEGATSIYADCFAIYGFSELPCYAHEAVLAVARQSLDRVVRRIDEPDFHETMPYPMPPEWRNHGVPMIHDGSGSRAGATLDDDKLEDLACQYANRVMTHFVRPERKVLLEFLTRDYQELPPACRDIRHAGACHRVDVVHHACRPASR